MGWKPMRHTARMAVLRRDFAWLHTYFGLGAATCFVNTPALGACCLGGCDTIQTGTAYDDVYSFICGEVVIQLPRRKTDCAIYL